MPPGLWESDQSLLLTTYLSNSDALSMKQYSFLQQPLHDGQSLKLWSSKIIDIVIPYVKHLKLTGAVWSMARPRAKMTFSLCWRILCSLLSRLCLADTNASCWGSVKLRASYADDTALNQRLSGRRLKHSCTRLCTKKPCKQWEVRCHESAALSEPFVHLCTEVIQESVCWRVWEWDEGIWVFGRGGCGGWNSTRSWFQKALLGYATPFCISSLFQAYIAMVHWEKAATLFSSRLCKC